MNRKMRLLINNLMKRFYIYLANYKGYHFSKPYCLVFEKLYLFCLRRGEWNH